VTNEVPHISVCICTYNRPVLLKRLLTEVAKQETGGKFTYSVVLADNAPDESARVTVAEMRASSDLLIKYCSEPRRGIAHVRNKVIENAEGEYVAFIDDDEFPVSNWLLILLNTCDEYNADGAFGPVTRHFDVTPPAWVAKSQFYDRRVNPTGMPVEWREARTGNVLLKRKILVEDPSPFRPEFRVGEDQDFFRRKMEKGYKFVWSSEAVAYEVVPPARWDRVYLIKKALLRGACAALQPSCGAASIAKSLVAVPLYAIALPFILPFGQHRFMTILVKLCDHLGKLLALVGIHPIKEAYVSEEAAQ
jgi:glycosyltransferase involved in cell wall biosynthesis